MQYAATDEEYRDCLSCPHHPQHLEGGISAGLGEVAGRGDCGEIVFWCFFAVDWRI